jgi:uncharacterized membrane protein
VTTWQLNKGTLLAAGLLPTKLATVKKSIIPCTPEAWQLGMATIATLNMDIALFAFYMSNMTLLLAVGKSYSEAVINRSRKKDFSI